LTDKLTRAKLWNESVSRVTRMDFVILDELGYLPF